MINSYDINSHVQKNILNGAKTPHSTSYPVNVLSVVMYTILMIEIILANVDSISIEMY